MKRLQGLVVACVGGVVLIGGAYLGYSRVYAGPMGEAKGDLSRWRSAARGYERDLEGSGAVRSRLREIAGTTLGTTEEEVAHRFRTLLHEMATTAGLRDITVTEGRTSIETNPATQVRLQGFSRDERRTSDFSVMNGEVRGAGSLEQVARLLELSESQAWIHRVSSFVVAPTGDARDVFEVRVSVATLILPDMGPPADVQHAVSPLEPGAESAWASIVSKNVFRMPTPPTPEPPPVVAEPTPQPVHEVPAGPPPQPYFAWRLAGVMEGARGISVVMVNDGAGQSVSVAVGESVLDAALVRAGGESALFVIDGVEFEVRLGQTLADRRPVDPASSL
jgi:hypothetical protein